MAPARRASPGKKSSAVSEISEIIEESRQILSKNALEPELISSSVLNAKTQPGLDESYLLEKKEFSFQKEPLSFCNDTNKEIFPGENIPQDTEDKKNRVVYKEPFSYFSTPPRKRQPPAPPRSPQLIEPDESLDLETGTLYRRGKEQHPIKQGLLETQEENKNIFQSTKISRSNNQEFPYFPGFKTASGTALKLTEESLTSARRSLDFLQENAAYKQKPKIILPRHADTELAYQVYQKVQKAIFPLTRTLSERHTIFYVFKWAWLSVLPDIQEIRKRGSDIQAKQIETLVLRTAIQRWKTDPLSVLKRIAEKDEAPSKYMKVMVVSEGKETIRVTDGIYDLCVGLDNHLKEISHKLTVGTILQVVGSIYLEHSPLEISQADCSNKPIIQLQYNGTKPCYSGPLGYQSKCAYMRSISAIKPQGGIIACLHLKLTSVIKSKYVLNLNGSKSILDETQFPDALYRVHKHIKSMNLSSEEESQMKSKISKKKFTQYEIECMNTSQPTKATLTIWNPPEELKLRHTFLFFFLDSSKYPSSTNTLALTTTQYTLIKDMGKYKHK
ncbi:hypothetical protein NEOKW01_1244 [Nematocida sp. AWRm80]|nr:hypothetical protein NEOKW01_1244 [Nematocida sp. AWRm80]